LDPFRGAFNHTVDAKNRMTIPKKFRPGFTGNVVLARPTDGSPCFGIWRPEDFQAHCAEAIEQQPPLSTKRAELERFFYGNAHDAEIDAAGRVNIPAGFSESARIDKDVVVVGAGPRLEVWSPDVWTAHQASLRESMAAITADADAAA
jgi:MraZ protein